LIDLTPTTQSGRENSADSLFSATADRKPDKLPTTLTGAPVETVPPGPLPAMSDIALPDLSVSLEQLERGRSMEEGDTGEADIGMDEESMEVDGIAIAVR
jgi:hypothetical protein